MYNKPYIWFYAHIPYKHYLLYKTQERETESHTFMEGHRVPFDTGNPNLSFTMQDPKDYDLIYDSLILPEVFLKKYDVWPNNGIAPIVNQRVVDILNDLCPEQVQVFPITVKNENAKLPTFEDHHYFLINICQTYDGVDKQKSEYDYLLDGRPYSLNKWHFTEESHEHMPHIARHELSRGQILVSPRLVQAFTKAKVKGVQFYKDEWVNF